MTHRRPVSINLRKNRERKEETDKKLDVWKYIYLMYIRLSEVSIRNSWPMCIAQSANVAMHLFQICINVNNCAYTRG